MNSYTIHNYMTSLEAAKLLGVAHRTMRHYAAKYPNLSIKVANRLLIDKSQLDRLMSSRLLNQPATKKEACHD